MEDWFITGAVAAALNVTRTDIKPIFGYPLFGHFYDHEVIDGPIVFRPVERTSMRGVNWLMLLKRMNLTRYYGKNCKYSTIVISVKLENWLLSNSTVSDSVALRAVFVLVDCFDCETLELWSLIMLKWIPFEEVAIIEFVVMPAFFVAEILNYILK